MAEAAKHALELETFNVVADAGYSNGEQAAHCEAVGMIPYVPVMRTVNNQGDGTLFGRTDFRYEPESDSYICPGDKRLLRKHTNHKDRYTMYKASSAIQPPLQPFPLSFFQPFSEPSVIVFVRSYEL